jgi:hypothetical protein
MLIGFHRVPLRTTGVHQLIHIEESGIAEVTDLGRGTAHSFEEFDPKKYRVDLPETTRQRPGKTDQGLTVRPWLYGNWWILNCPNFYNEFIPFQLIGVGVRLTEWPEPHDCKIYKTEAIHYRGSSLRVFTDDGRLASV